MPPPKPSVRAAPVEGTQAVDRATFLLHQVSAKRDAGASLTDLVAESGLKQPTVHRLLTALSRAGLLEQDPSNKRYYLGFESYVLGAIAQERFGLHHAAVGSVTRLAHLSEDTAFLTVRRGHFAVCLHREEGVFPIRTQVLSVGDRHPLGIGAGSIALLAALPDDEVELILKANEDIYKTSYPRVFEKLRELIDETRLRGFATHRGLTYAGSWGLGVAVTDETGQPSTALSIGAIESRMDKERQEMLGKLLREEADRLKEQLRTHYRSRTNSSLRRRS